jgi:hypothetical protein
VFFLWLATSFRWSLLPTKKKSLLCSQGFPFLPKLRDWAKKPVFISRLSLNLYLCIQTKNHDPFHQKIQTIYRFFPYFFYRYADRFLFCTKTKKDTSNLQSVRCKSRIGGHNSTTH